MKRLLHHPQIITDHVKNNAAQVIFKMYVSGHFQSQQFFDFIKMYEVGRNMLNCCWNR